MKECAGFTTEPCRKNFRHAKPCGPSPDGDDMSCACGCAADDVFCANHDPEISAELETAKDLLRQVLLGEDVLTDRKWMRAAKRLVDET